MQLDTQLLTVIESLQNALQVGERATNVDCPVDADGAPFLDPLDGSPDPSYAYAYGWSTSSIKSAITSLELIRGLVTVK